MRRFIFGSRKRKVAFLAALLTLIVAGVAAAYYLASGSGSDNFTIGTSPISLTVAVDASNASINFVPGSSRNIKWKITNQDGGEPYVGRLVGSLTGLPGGCLASWFTYPDVIVAEGVPSGGGHSSAGYGSGDETGSPAVLTFVDLPVDQSACSAGTPTITLTIAP